jgi:hypothetical protein
MSKAVLISVSLAIGIGLGTFIGRNLLSTPQNSASLEASADGVSPSAPVQATLADSGAAVTLDIEPIRAMLREELNAALARSQGSQADAQAQLQPAPASTLSVQQQRDTLQAVEGLVSGGHWGDEERNDFHQKLAQLDPQQREQAMQQLVQAINNGSLKVSTNGPPL